MSTTASFEDIIATDDLICELLDVESSDDSDTEYEEYGESVLTMLLLKRPISKYHVMSGTVMRKTGTMKMNLTHLLQKRVTKNTTTSLIQNVVPFLYPRMDTYHIVME
jgi:hypothetical protein